MLPNKTTRVSALINILLCSTSIAVQSVEGVVLLFKQGVLYAIEVSSKNEVSTKKYFCLHVKSELKFMCAVKPEIFIQC